MQLPFVSSDLRLVVVNLNGFQSSLAMVMCAIAAHRVTTGRTVGTLGTVVRGSTETSGLVLNGSATMISAEVSLPFFSPFRQLTSKCFNGGFTFEAMV